MTAQLLAQGGALGGTRPVHVVIAIPVLLVGGTEIQTLALARALASNGYRVTVCCYHQYDGSMVSRFRAAGAEVVLLDWGRDRPLWRIVLGLRRVFASWRPDIVHVQYLQPGLAAVLAARLAGVPLVLATMHLPGYGLRARVFVRIARALCDAFIFVSGNLERFWCGASHVSDPARPGAGVPHETIQNCVDLEALSAVSARVDRARLRESLDLGTGPTIGVVGRLRAEKGQRVLIEAIPRILEPFRDARVLVVGDGLDRAELVQLADRLGVGGSIRWLGRVPPERVPETYVAVDVLAVPSLFEGFGLVAAEAMAMGLPVVATRTDGLSEVVIDGITGVLVPAGDSGALADALVQVLADPAAARQMGLRGRERVRECFSRERFEKQILATYARVRGCPLSSEAQGHDAA